MAELKPYNPTLRDRLAAALMGDDRPSSARRSFVEGLTGSTGLGATGMGLVDVVPGGQVFALDEAAREGDPQAAAMALPASVQLGLALQMSGEEGPSTDQ